MEVNKTKEAIKFVSKHIADFRERTEDAFDKEGCKKLIMEAKGVITLLQQGEALKVENVELRAYKQMWEKFYKEWGEYPIELHNIAEFMGDLEQKYLKEANPDEAGKAKDNRE